MPIIELINASIFQNNKSVLKNVNIEVAKGDFVFLIGRTGSGTVSYTHLTLPTIYSV